MTPRMKTKFQGAVAQKVKAQFQIPNPMALPRLDKIVVNVGIGKQLEGSKLNPKAKEQVLSDLAIITGQKAVMRVAKKSVSNFKLREGYEVGAMVTLRGNRMWEFIDRLISLAIPRIKDFRGLNPKSFDGRGNYAMGVKEHIVFPEINYDKVDQIWGMDIIVCTTAKTDEEARELLRLFDFPFRQ